MKRLQVGDECYVRYKGEILSIFWDENAARILRNCRKDARLIYPYPIIKKIAK